MTDSTQFPAITESARAYGRADSRVVDAKAKAVDAYRAAGAETEAMKSAFLIGYMIGALNLQANGESKAAKARAIMEKKGFTTKARADARRTEKQDAAYAAARQALKRIRDAAGVKPADQRGTNSKAPKGKEDGAAKATPAADSSKGESKTPATMIPAAASPKDAATFLLAYANKSPKAFEGKEGKALQRAIHAFHSAQVTTDH